MGSASLPPPTPSCFERRAAISNQIRSNLRLFARRTPWAEISLRTSSLLPAFEFLFLAKSPHGSAAAAASGRIRGICICNLAAVIKGERRRGEGGGGGSTGPGFSSVCGHFLRRRLMACISRADRRFLRASASLNSDKPPSFARAKWPIALVFPARWSIQLILPHPLGFLLGPLV